CLTGRIAASAIALKRDLRLGLSFDLFPRARDRPAPKRVVPPSHEQGVLRRLDIALLLGGRRTLTVTIADRHPGRAPFVRIEAPDHRQNPTRALRLDPAHRLR